MTTSIALSLLLSTMPSTPAAPSPTRASPPGVVDPSGQAWAVVYDGQLWVCWAIASDCWTRIDLDEAERAAQDLDLDEDDPFTIEDDPELPDARGTWTPEQWRLGFSDGATLWIELDDQRWRVDRGSRAARIVDGVSTASLARPRSFRCGPKGRVPAATGGRLEWVGARACEPLAPAGSCVASQTVPRPRRPVPLSLRAGIQIAAVRAWSSDDAIPTTPRVDRLQTQAGLEVSFVVELGFDRARSLADDRTRALLLRDHRSRALPSIPAGPLADAERRAHAAVLCGGPT
jgi:hypothetical protein